MLHCLLLMHHVAFFAIENVKNACMETEIFTGRSTFADQQVWLEETKTRTNLVQVADTADK